MKNKYACILLLMNLSSALAQPGNTVFDSPTVTLHTDTMVKELGIVEKISLRTIRPVTFSPVGESRYYAARSLNQLLSENSGIYFKNYGNGQLSSVSYRGTGAAQTDVLWNGIRLNNPSLGQVDFALFAVNGMQSVMMGGMAATGNIGAVIQLQGYQQTDSVFVADGSLTYGSFETWRVGLTVKHGNKKIMGVTSFNYLNTRNNFSFINNYKPGSPSEIQTNARVSTLNIMQQLSIRIKNNHNIYVGAWLTDAQRQIPPVVSKPQSSERQDDYSMRTMLGWHGYYKDISVNYTTAWLHDVIDYANPDINLRSKSTMQAFRNSAKVQYQPIEGLITKFLWDYDIERAMVPAYALIKVRHVNRWMASATYIPTGDITLELLLRQALFNTTGSPFSPALKVHYAKGFKECGVITVFGVAARNFRFPTLNDWYWQPGGNIHLKPEKSWDGEMGICFSHIHKITFFAEAKGYVKHVTDWIQWLSNGSYWEPMNVRRVLSRGLESKIQLKWSNTQWLTSMLLNYNFTKATNLRAVAGNDNSIGKQLIYVPLHVFTTTAHVAFKNYYIRATGNITDKVYVTTDNSQFLRGFALLDIELGKDFVIRHHTVGASFKISNLTNTNYQIVLQRPMPGRSYEGTITFKFLK